jgi:transcriptional regulator with XRE-family HTH domain
MNTSSRIAKNARLHRANLGLTQSEVAKRADLTQVYVGKIEAGDSNLTVKTLVKLAEALETTPAALIKSPSINGMGLE